MRAIHWIRSRQESEELSYWLSIVSYNPKDRSFSNRMYLFYLVVFFSIWWFMVLLWFANTGANLLALLFPGAEGSAAVGLELGVLLIWFLTFMIQSLRRSPVAFSEEDATLVCQMPLKPRTLVLRWSAMPWVKSLIPFLLLAIALGFSLAEVSFRMEGVLEPDFFNYVIRGLRAAVVIIPVHLAVFALTWANGVWLMGHQRRGLAWVFPILNTVWAGMLLLLGILTSFGVILPGFLDPISRLLPNVLWAGFGIGNLGSVLLVSSLVGLLTVLCMVLSAARFSASRAAQETQDQMTNRDLRRYGFSDQVRERKNQKRLGTSRRARWQPGWTGAAAFIWKDMLETSRSINTSYLYNLLTFLGVGLGLVFIPNLAGRIILILTWALQASKFLTGRLREDLANWVTLRQLPLEPETIILTDIALASGLMVLVGLMGMLGGGALSGEFPLGEILSLPGMIASVVGVSAWTIFKHSKVDLLLVGRAPGTTEFSVLIAALCAGIPVVINSLLPGLMGDIFGLLASIFIGRSALMAAVKAFQTIE